MDEIEHANNDIDEYKLVFIDSSREKCNFNIFSVSVSFLSAIYNGEISLKGADFSQRNLEKKNRGART